MMNKEFVLVSQGIEIMRTKSQEVAINEVKRGNDEYFDNCQRCTDNYERPADNYIELFIETDYDKKLEQENTNLKQALNEIRKYSLGNIHALENRLSTPFCDFEKASKELMIHKNYYELITGKEYDELDKVLGGNE